MKSYLAVILSLLIFSPLFFPSEINAQEESTQAANIKNESAKTELNLKSTNNTVIQTNVLSNANTGGNKANYNSGGNVTIITGIATVKTEILNTTNTTLTFPTSSSLPNPK